MATDQKQLNVRVRPDTRDALVEKATRSGQTLQAYVSGIVEREIEPQREAFVSGLAEDMTGMLDEFEAAFEPGSR